MKKDIEGPSIAGQQNQISKRWYAVRTMSRHEKRVACEFDRKGMTAFLPLTTERRLWSDREKEVSIPLFPGYVFVQMALSAAQRLDVLRSGGVVSFVPQSGVPAEVPAEQIDGVRAMLSLQEKCETRPYAETGQRVRVKGGSLDGVEGVLINQNKNSMLVVSIDAIGKSVAIRFHGYECEPV